MSIKLIQWKRKIKVSSFVTNVAHTILRQQDCTAADERLNQRIFKRLSSNLNVTVKSTKCYRTKSNYVIDKQTLVKPAINVL